MSHQNRTPLKKRYPLLKDGTPLAKAHETIHNLVNANFTLKEELGKYKSYMKFLDDARTHIKLSDLMLHVVNKQGGEEE